MCLFDMKVSPLSLYKWEQRISEEMAHIDDLDICPSNLYVGVESQLLQLSS